MKLASMLLEKIEIEIPGDSYNPQDDGYEFVLVPKTGPFVTIVSIKGKTFYIDGLKQAKSRIIGDKLRNTGIYSIATFMPFELYKAVKAGR
jgi:hypothetical protein